MRDPGAMQNVLGGRLAGAFCSVGGEWRSRTDRGGSSVPSVRGWGILPGRVRPVDGVVGSQTNDDYLKRKVH